MTEQQTMTTLEQETRQLLELLDAMDIGRLDAMFTDDAQAVDEISGSWTRGRSALHGHLATATGRGFRRPIPDPPLHTVQWGAVGWSRSFCSRRSACGRGVPKALGRRTSAAGHVLELRPYTAFAGGAGVAGSSE
ncbi:MAG TPA: hypothetical protein VGL78_17305 [Solirubrobacteraceae bacterium]|jgi:ketosteroid isomerase-like protein